MKVKRFYPVTIVIDGDEVALRLKRLNFDEGNDFMKDWRRLNSPLAERFIYRKPGEEQNRREPQNDEERERPELLPYLVGEDEIEKRRLAEMNPEQRADYDRVCDEDDEFAVRTIRKAFEKYVEVESGLTVEDEDENGDVVERRVVKGSEFLEIFGARRAVWLRVLTALAVKTSLGGSEKKVSRLLIGSSDSSDEPAKDQHGATPATTVESAERAGSSSNGTAQDQQTEERRTNETSSGSMVSTESSPVPSVN